jgi:hypothetical protein
MKAQAKKLIAYLKKTNKTSTLQYYNGSNTYCWQYYYAISGWFEGKYFSIYLFKHKDSPSENKIAGTTDCKEEIRDLFNKYSLNEVR